MAELLTLPEINSALTFFEREYPTLCERIELPHKTHEGRTSYALRMGLPNNIRNSTSLMIGGVHAREWGGPDIVISFAGDILSAHSKRKGLEYNNLKFSEEEIRKLFEETTMVIFPCVNPDGFEHSRREFAYWRKNRNPKSAQGDARKIGVDINRNYDFLWDFRKHFHSDAVKLSSLASDDPSQSTFHGTAPFSEPETKNVKWLMDTFPGLAWFMDIHSFSGAVLFNWGAAENQSQQVSMSFTSAAYDGFRGRQRPPKYQEYINSTDDVVLEGAAEVIRDALNAVWGRPYVAKQAFALYPTSGSSEDYAYSRHIVQPGIRKTYGFTIEFNFGNPNDETNFIVTRDPVVLDKTLKEVVPGLIAFARLAIKPADIAPPPKAPHGELIHVNVFTGESWSIGPGGIIKHPPIPDPYVTELGREIGRLLGAYETLSKSPGDAGELARTAILDSIALLAQKRSI